MRPVAAAPSGSGFSKQSKPPAKPAEVKPAKAKPIPTLPGWTTVGVEAELFQEGKQVRAVELGARALAMYKYEGRIYASDALSTAYKFPLIDATLLPGPLAEVPLDGTQYDLETGKVVVWCPANSPARSVLNMLKKNETPIDLRVYPTQVVDGNVYVKLR